jgi:isoleucyl-tRNA synthetase
VVKDEELKDAFSSEDIKGLRIGVKPAPGDKCERCWVHDTTVGSHHEHPTICQRCKDALEQID